MHRHLPCVRMPAIGDDKALLVFQDHMAILPSNVD